MSNEMIASYKESSTKEELNEKSVKHGHTKKHLYLMASMTIELVFDTVCFHCRLLVMVVLKNYMGDIIP